MYNESVELDADVCYRVLKARDRRFDGLFFVGVTTTGVYCRPGCPARLPGRARCRFFRRAVQAEAEGFRACFRCRPELAPGAAPMAAVSRLVARAVTRIEEGALNDRKLPALATELGVTARHLRRAVKHELGVSPVRLAQWNRLALAKQLLQDTDLPLAQVAFGSGFSSIRRFNATFRERFGRPPSEVRRKAAGIGGALSLSLGYREPFAWESLLEFLSARATPGVAAVVDGRYRRTIRIGGTTGWIDARRDVKSRTVKLDVSSSLLAHLPAVARRARHVFDLDAQPLRVASHLKQDRALRRVLRDTPGLRVPGSFDAFELCVRTVLGQQVSVRGATTLAGRLCSRLGESIETPWPELNRLAPTPERVAGADARSLTATGLTGSRARTVRAIARRFVDGSLAIAIGADSEDVADSLLSIAGIGPWSAQYICMRGLGAPDAFPSGDLGLRRAFNGIPTSELEARADAWRPWRAYAAMNVWRLL